MGFTLLGSLCIRVKIYTETKQDQERFGDILGAMQTFVLFLILYQACQKRRVKEDGEGEETMGVVDTLKTIPGIKYIIMVLERFIQVFYDATSAIVPDKWEAGLGDAKEVFDDVKEGTKEALEGIDLGEEVGILMDKAKEMASSII